MTKSIDHTKTLEIIKKMKLAKIGDDKKWNDIINKINKKKKIDRDEQEYFSITTRIYKDSSKTIKSKIYHTKLSEFDGKPPCRICGIDSAYYCNMNDQYFCFIHVVGHDKNEI